MQKFALWPKLYQKQFGSNVEKIPLKEPAGL